VVREKFRIYLFFQELEFINVTCTIKIVNVLKCREKNIYKVYTKTGLVFHCSYINTCFPLSSKCVKPEEWQLRNSETSQKTSILQVGINIYST